MRTHTARSDIARMIRRLERISDTTECGILVPDAHWVPDRPNVRGPASSDGRSIPPLSVSANAYWNICVEAAVELPRGEKSYAVVP